jgi:SNF2 family DNA or RNA helicase
MLRPDCPECGKPARQVSSFHVNLPKVVDGVVKPIRTLITKLECGHSIREEKCEIFDFSSLRSVTNKFLFPFQIEACERSVKSGFKAILRLDMGLGKTVISATLLRQYWKELTPALIICKASMTEQWLQELMDWCPDRLFQILESTRDRPAKGFKAFIVSQDLLAPRTDKKGQVKENSGLPWLMDYPLKTIIYDEVQHIKNPDAKRTRFVQDLAAKTPNFLAPSGTPIKNHFGEYFTILNIIDPKNFSNRTFFIDQFCEYTYSKTTGGTKAPKIGGLRKDRYDRFHEITKNYIIDYERDVVMAQLPKIFRQRRYFAMGQETKEAYARELENFMSIYEDEDDNEFSKRNRIDQSFIVMRQIVGFSKVAPTVDYVTEWLDDHDEERELLNGGSKLVAKPKIVIFIHHINVGTILESKLTPILRERGFEPPIRLLGGISGKQSYAIEQEFKNNPLRRVLIASTLAAGEGKNFQFCSDAVLMERQWNPPNEEQAEARFPRPGTTASQVNILYPVALGTVDEYLAELVEKKRQYLLTAKGKWSNFNESEIMKELIEKLAREGRKKWAM